VYKRVLKSLSAVGLLLATGLMLGSCDKGVTDPNENKETAPINFTAYAVGTPVSTVVIEVTAADIKNRLVFNLTFDEDFVASGVLEVPVGEARLFSVTTYDDHHNVTHTGDAEMDVSPGSNPPLQVKLKPVLGDVDITVSLGDYAVIVTPAAATIDASGGGTTVQLAVTVYDQYGEQVVDPQVQWATTHPTVATVSPTGLVTGLADGEATIVATYGGVAGMSEVTLINFGGGSPTPDWQPQTSGTTQTLTGIWGSSATDVYAVGWDGTILHYEGTDWSADLSGDGSILHAVWGSSAMDVFAVGHTSSPNEAVILHYDRTGWNVQTQMDDGINLSDVWGSSASDVFAVGAFRYENKILHYDGNSWTGQATGLPLETPITCIWGSSATDVFAVGVGSNEMVAVVLHYDGTGWSEHTSGIEVQLYGLWGSSATDVFAVGQLGTILHYDGNSWTEQTSGTTQTLTGIWGSSASNVFVVGGNGTILHYDGTGWTAQASGTTENLSEVWGSSASDVYAVGVNGTILHYGF
jgi:hypothetical protein